jgi:hypothetical protein
MLLKRTYCVTNLLLETPLMAGRFLRTAYLFPIKRCGGQVPMKGKYYGTFDGEAWRT